MLTDRGYPFSQAATISGMTKRQLAHSLKTGLVKSAIEPAGDAGFRYVLSVDDVLVAYAMHKIREKYKSTAVQRYLSEWLYDKLAEDPPAVPFMSSVLFMSHRKTIEGRAFTIFMCNHGGWSALYCPDGPDLIVDFQDVDDPYAEETPDTMTTEAVPDSPPDVAAQSERRVTRISITSEEPTPDDLANEAVEFDKEYIDVGGGDLSLEDLIEAEDLPADGEDESE